MLNKEIFLFLLEKMTLGVYINDVLRENPNWYPDTERELKKHDGKTPLGK